jgi:hypothetical protein
MTVLPIVDRELRAAARRRATYWVRLTLTLNAIFIGSVIFLATFDQPSAQTGRYMFEGLAGVMLFYCLAYGRRSTADCLSVEKREGTLGLLFLTDLKGLDVVLGKLVATSMGGFYGLLAVFPVLAVPLLLGGITSGEFWRVVLVLIDTCLFSLAIGVFGSALTRDHQRAMAANFLGLLLLMAVPAACKFALEYFAPRLRPLPELLFSCPVYAFYLCEDVRYLLSPAYYWWTVGVMHGLTWLLVLGAGWVAPRAWQERSSCGQQGGRRELWHSWVNGPTSGRSQFRQRTLEENAFYWLAARSRFKPVHVWTFLGCMAVWWLACWALIGSFWLDNSAGILTALLLNFALKVWLAIEAGRQLAEDRRTGAFEVLLSAPLTVRDIVRGQLLALRRQFLWPALVVLGVETVLIVELRLHDPGFQMQAAWLAGMLMLVADLVTLAWVGMSRALVARNHNLATISTISRVLVLPWALFGTTVAVANVGYLLALGRAWDPGQLFYVKLWLGLGLAVDLAFGLAAWWQLRYRFRQIALRSFDPVASGFVHWFSPELHAAAAPGLHPNEPQSTAEHGARTERGISAVTATTPAKQTAVSRRRRLALACCVALVPVTLGIVHLWPHSPVAPAVMVSLTHSNGPVRVYSGAAGMLLILPDGSLWRWGKAGAIGVTAARTPVQVGTDHEWVQAAAGYAYMIALRQDGTMWEWGRTSFGPGWVANSLSSPRQVGDGHDWISVAATANHSMALRNDGTLWAWGDKSAGQLGIEPDPPLTNSSTVSIPGDRIRQGRFVPRQILTDPVQVGTNDNWATVSCPWNCTLALRKDGTLWAWGSVPVVGPGWMNTRQLPLPTQVCKESNWTGMTDGYLALVWNRAGELWEPFHGGCSPEATAASTFRFVGPSAVSVRFAFAWGGGGPELCELRPDGTLWRRTQPIGTSAVPVGEWHRIGKRSDWIGLWGSGGGTAVGLTADGTLWTWGFDPGREPELNLSARLKLVQSRLLTLVGPGARPVSVGSARAMQKEPRPLIKMVMARVTPP